LRPDVKKVTNGEIGWIGAAPAPPRDKGQQAKVNIETDLYAEIHKSLLKSFVRTADLLEMTWRVIAGIFVGDVSIGNISGPISIAGHAGSSSQAGFYSFLFFLGVLSISVAVINLLPLPALDGGQIILFIFEALRGVPFSAGFLSWWTRIGAVTIAGIMVLALANDIYTVFK
jgi:regulator of sigma E protease